MATSIALSRTIALAQNFIRNAPLTFAGTSDPAFSNADWVRQFIISPPFAWRWNRATIDPKTLTIGTQDYTINLPDFGWLEKATVFDSATSQTYELEFITALATDNVPNLPTRIATRIDDGAGNITFRLLPTPDKAYVLNIDYQKAAPLFVSTQDKWAPIPDYLSYLYNQGFLAKAYEYLGDPRVSEAMPLFLRQLVSANQGLSETQMNIFLADSLNTLRESASVQQGKQGKYLQ